MERNIGISDRKEDNREVKEVETKRATNFDLSAIINHFDLNAKNVRSLSNSIEDENSEDAKIIYRSQIVFFGSLLDFYMHEIYKYLFYQKLSREVPDKGFDKIKISMKYVVAVINSTEYMNVLLTGFTEEISRDTYMSQQAIKEIIAFGGLSYNNVTETAFKDIKNPAGRTGVIIALYKRRNEIAHQFDRNHFDAQQMDITREDAEEYIERVTSLVYAIQDGLRELQDN